MARKSKLLAALDAHKGRDFEAEQRAKKVKAAEKRKRQKEEVRRDNVWALNNGEERSPTTQDDTEQVQASKQTADDDFEDFSDPESEDEERQAPTTSEADDAESDIPLSELSEEDRADTIPHQRLTINNRAALLAATKRIAVTHPKMKFSAHNSLILTSLPPAPASIPDPNDDLTRELEFYRICRTAATDAEALLKKAKVPFTRPSDYFAEMVKSDEHMGRVKKKMYDEAANKKAAAEARKVRDAKKFGKAVQIAKEQERAKEKRQTLEKISSLKRKRKGQDTGTVNEGDDLFQNIDIDDSSGKPDHLPRRNGPGGPGASSSGNFKRQKRDQKFGYGGKKRYSKSGDAASTADMRGWPGRNMKAGGGGGRGGGSGGGGGGTKKRLGKSRRAVAAR